MFTACLGRVSNHRVSQSDLTERACADNASPRQWPFNGCFHVQIALNGLSHYFFVLLNRNHGKDGNRSASTIAVSLQIIRLRAGHNLVAGKQRQLVVW